ncbi:MAG: hypothetical protein SGJ24_12375 [Chloroflexota bacterium]|nr:hypothetical protein [Chloroflexota bacterium]
MTHNETRLTYNATPERMYIVRPATTDHAPHLQHLAQVAYNVTPETAFDWFHPDQYRSRMAAFAEGQYVAVDSANGQVVGFTSGMRFNFNPAVPFTEDWEHTTGYG